MDFVICVVIAAIISMLIPVKKDDKYKKQNTKLVANDIASTDKEKDI